MNAPIPVLFVTGFPGIERTTSFDIFEIAVC